MHKRTVSSVPIELLFECLLKADRLLQCFLCLFFCFVFLLLFFWGGVCPHFMSQLKSPPTSGNHNERLLKATGNVSSHY